MKKFLEFLSLSLPILTIFILFFVGFFLERRAIKKIKNIVKAKGWESYYNILHSLRGLITFWFLLTGIFMVLPVLGINPGLFTIIQKILIALFLGGLTLYVSRLSIGFLRISTSKNEESSPLTSLFEYLIKLLIFSLGILIILQSIGIAITPLLTAFGVGGVSLGLAFQNTLSNLLSGINIITSKKIRPGDYIKLKTGEEGYVVDVELKYTVIREITNNLLVIPNAEITSSSFTNYSLPDKTMLLPIEISVGYDNDLEKVESITLEVAKEILNEVPGGVRDYQPFIRYENFDYFSINLTVYLKIQEYFDNLIIRHEFIKKIYTRYREMGVSIPFPVQSAYIPPHQN